MQTFHSLSLSLPWPDKMQPFRPGQACQQFLFTVIAQEHAQASVRVRHMHVMFSITLPAKNSSPTSSPMSVVSSHFKGHEQASTAQTSSRPCWNSSMPGEVMKGCITWTLPFPLLTCHRLASWFKSAAYRSATAAQGTAHIFQASALS